MTAYNEFNEKGIQPTFKQIEDTVKQMYKPSAKGKRKTKQKTHFGKPLSTNTKSVTKEIENRKRKRNAEESKGNENTPPNRKPKDRPINIEKVVKEKHSHRGFQNDIGFINDEVDEVDMSFLDE